MLIVLSAFLRNTVEIGIRIFVSWTIADAEAIRVRATVVKENREPRPVARI